MALPPALSSTYLPVSAGTHALSSGVSTPVLVNLTESSQDKNYYFTSWGLTNQQTPLTFSVRCAHGQQPAEQHDDKKYCEVLHNSAKEQLTKVVS